MIAKSEPVRRSDTLITADAGYHSDANVKALQEQGIPAMVADTQMRQRDERIDNAHHKAKGDPLYDKSAVKTLKFFRPEDFQFNDDNTATCPAGKTLASGGAWYRTPRGPRYQRFEAQAQDCLRCHLRTRCQRDITSPRGRQVSRFEPKRANEHDPSERMRRAIDSPQGRRLYSQRIATVEPVFANIRHHKRMSRFTLRGRVKVSTQWNLFCLVHNIEKIAH